MIGYLGMRYAHLYKSLPRPLVVDHATRSEFCQTVVRTLRLLFSLVVTGLFLRFVSPYLANLPMLLVLSIPSLGALVLLLKKYVFGMGRIDLSETGSLNLMLAGAGVLGFLMVVCATLLAPSWQRFVQGLLPFWADALTIVLGVAYYYLALLFSGLFLLIWLHAYQARQSNRKPKPRRHIMQTIGQTLMQLQLSLLITTWPAQTYWRQSCRSITSKTVKILLLLLWPLPLTIDLLLFATCLPLAILIELFRLFSQGFSAVARSIARFVQELGRSASLYIYRWARWSLIMALAWVYVQVEYSGIVSPTGKTVYATLAGGLALSVILPSLMNATKTRRVLWN